MVALLRLKDSLKREFRTHRYKARDGGAKESSAQETEIGQNKLEVSLGYLVSLRLTCLHNDIPSPISGAFDFVLFLFLAETGSLLYSPGDPPASASLKLELQLCVTIPGLLNIFFLVIVVVFLHRVSLRTLTILEFTL